MNNIARFCSLLAGMTLMGGSLQALSAANPAMPAAPVVKVPAGRPAATPLTMQKSAPPSYHSYTFFGDRYRDPFIPLNGEVRADSLYDRPPQIASLALKGIIQDAHGRMALLASGPSSYILRNGHLYDGRNKVVKKISGIIKTDSVVLIGSDHSVRELRAKSTL